MESKFHYRLSKKAESDLDHIVSYIALELSNLQAATNFVNKLRKVLDETCSFPESGSMVDNEFLPDVGVRKKFVGNFIVYYVPVMEEKLIYVARIVYGKRNMDEILRQMDL